MIRIFPGWTVPTKGEYFSYKWDNFPLQIKTSAALGENKGVWVRGNVDEDSSPLPSWNEIEVSLYWTLSDNSVWLAYHQTGPGQEFFSDVPEETEKTWTLFKMKRKLVIECNGVKVWEIEYKNLYDTQSTVQRSMKALSKTVTELKFNSPVDTATDEYRMAGKLTGRLIN